MNESSQKILFSRNLNALLSERRKTQKEVADAIGVSPQNFNTWSKGVALPRMEKLEKLADYFSIPKFALFEDQKTQSPHRKTLSIQTKRSALPLSKEGDALDTKLYRYSSLMNNEGKEQLISRARELLRLGYTKPGKKKLPEELLKSEQKPEVHNETIEYYLL